jgi:hypothetical protein
MSGSSLPSAGAMMRQLPWEIENFQERVCRVNLCQVDLLTGFKREQVLFIAFIEGSQ